MRFIVFIGNGARIRRNYFVTANKIGMGDFQLCDGQRPLGACDE